MEKSTFLNLNLPCIEDPMSIDAITQNFEILDAQVANITKSIQTTPTESAFQQIILGKPVTAMGLEIFTKSGQFDPAKYGLKVGQLIQVLAVAGGGGGGGRGGDRTCSSIVIKGGAGASGNAGQLILKTMVLESLSPISIIIGKGGAAGTRGADKSATGSIATSTIPQCYGGDGDNGENTIFGEDIVAVGGEGGHGGSFCSVAATTSSVAAGGSSVPSDTAYTLGISGGSGSKDSTASIARGGRGYVIGEPIQFGGRGYNDKNPNKLYASYNGKAPGFGAGGDSGFSGADGVCIVTW